MNLSKLKKELDRVFSIYVRKRDEIDGMVKCCTCQNWGVWSKMQCGHFISRKVLSLRWDEKNTGVQCVACNIFRQGEQHKFGIYLEDKYGKEVFEYLNSKKNNTVKMGEFEYKLLIEEFKQKIK